MTLRKKQLTRGALEAVLTPQADHVADFIMNGISAFAQGPCRRPGKNFVRFLIFLLTAARPRARVER